MKRICEVWNTRTRGTLTAEQVREAIEKRFDFDVWVPKERWQAIADELNACAERTCEEIVRCRDCLSWHKGYCYKHAYEVANEYGEIFTEGCFPMDADGFCSLGARRDA